MAHQGCGRRIAMRFAVFMAIGVFYIVLAQQAFLEGERMMEMVKSALHDLF